MGSFNLACFASHQTIAGGDKCRVVPIGQSCTFRPIPLKLGDSQSLQYGSANSNVYADCFWKPQSGFIPAVYGDYGSVTLQLSPYTRQMLVHFFAQALADTPVAQPTEGSPRGGTFDFRAFLAKGDTPLLAAVLLESQRGLAMPAGRLHEADAEFALLWEYLWEAARENRLFMRTYADAVLPLQFAVIHERTYQVLVETIASAKNWDGESMAQRDFLGRCLATAKVEQTEWMERDKQEGREGAGLGDWHLSDAMHAALSRADGNTRYPRRTADSLVRFAAHQLVKGELTEDELLAKLEPMVTDRYAMAALDCFNLKFSPVIYAGQDYSNSIGRSFLKFASRVCELVSKDRADAE